MNSVKKQNDDELFNQREIPTWLEGHEYTDRDMAVDAIPAWKHSIELMREKNLLDKNILDFGCSRGGFLQLLHKKMPFKYGLGVDLAVESLQAARESLNGEPIEYKHGNQLANYPEYFDIAQSHWVVFHFENIEYHAQQIHHVMKQGGVYYFHTGEHTESEIWKKWQPLLKNRSQLQTYTHSPQDYKTAFENCGFDVEITPWAWEEKAFAKDFQPDAWYSTREEYENHYMNSVLMFRAVKR